MYQTDRGSYRKQESLAKQFRHSCLGQIIITAIVIGVILLLAAILNPSEQAMEQEMRDNVSQCIQSKDSLNNDWIDDIVDNVGYMFTTTDTIQDEQLTRAFNKYNKLRHQHHTFYSTVYLHNNMYLMGKRCGLGVFGLVVPMLNYKDILLREELMRIDTINHKLIKPRIEDEYFGENPGLEPFKYEGE